MMKHFCIIILMLLVAFNLFAQHEPIQPYEDLGIKVKVLTLSNGKYQESFPNDTLHRIGSVLFNRVTGEVETVVIDTLHGEYSLRADVPSRWLSPDPLAAQFPEWSPYPAMGDNPILFIDPDGRKWVNPYEGVEGYEEQAENVRNVLADLKSNDEELYNYIDNLKITVDNEEYDINVFVVISPLQEGKMGNPAEVSIGSIPKDGIYNGESIRVPFIKRTGVEHKLVSAPEIGFQIVLFQSAVNGIFDRGDNDLANETGDIMFYMEEHQLRQQEKQVKTIGQYESGWANDYSDAVENAYEHRKSKKKKKREKVEGIKKMYPLTIDGPNIYSNGKEIKLGKH